MDIQPKFKTQTSTRSSPTSGRCGPRSVGAVARGETLLDTHLENGVVDGDWADDDARRDRPRPRDHGARPGERFNIFCAPCHGWDGMGNGPVNERAIEGMNNAEGPPHGTSWTQARNLHDPGWSEQPIGQIYNTITNGKNSMAGYGSQMSSRTAGRSPSTSRPCSEARTRRCRTSPRPASEVSTDEQRTRRQGRSLGRQRPLGTAGSPRAADRRGRGRHRRARRQPRHRRSPGCSEPPTTSS